jgi:hypothetical protein
MKIFVFRTQKIYDFQAFLKKSIENKSFQNHNNLTKNKKTRQSSSYKKKAIDIIKYTLISCAPSSDLFSKKLKQKQNKFVNKKITRL